VRRSVSFTPVKETLIVFIVVSFLLYLYFLMNRIKQHARPAALLVRAENGRPLFDAKG
jgi:hypothetical protein